MTAPKVQPRTRKPMARSSAKETKSMTCSKGHDLKANGKWVQPKSGSMRCVCMVCRKETERVRTVKRLRDRHDTG